MTRNLQRQNLRHGLSEINLLYTVIAGRVKLAKGSFQTFLSFFGILIFLHFLAGDPKDPERPLRGSGLPNLFTPHFYHFRRWFYTASHWFFIALRFQPATFYRLPHSAVIDSLWRMAWALKPQLGSESS